MRMVHKHFSANGSANCFLRGAHCTRRIALCSLLVALCTLCDAQSATPFSQYGQIQNVQNYSSNPFWNPSGPYNQRMPTPVYVDGPEMNAGDCLRTVSALVANVCATTNNCVGMQLSDIRPTLMLQLSQLPGHTYATSCAGYIDTEFEKYVKKYGHAGTATGTVSFPTATTTQTAFPTPTTSVRNPYSPQTPEWEREYNERAAELAELQEQTATHGKELSHTDFPATFADFDFDERMDVLATGYDPYQGKSAYHPIKIQDYDDYITALKQTARIKVTYDCGDGGTGTPPPANENIPFNQPYTPTQNTCTGPETEPVFAGWLVVEDNATCRAGEKYTWQTMGNKTLKARWTEKKTYTIKYSCGNGSGTPPQSQSVSSGDDFTVQTQGECQCPNDEAFGGWEYNGETYSANQTITWTDETNATFTQQCGTVCIITYNCGDGRGTPPATETILKGERYTLAQDTLCPSQDPDKSFVSWTDGASTRGPGAQMTCDEGKSITYTAVYADGEFTDE